MKTALSRAIAPPDADRLIEGMWRTPLFGAKNLLKTGLKAFLSRRKVREALRMLQRCDFSEQELQVHLRFMAETHRKGTGPVRTVNWFIPAFEHADYGGIYTLLRFADYFQAHGMQNRLLVYDDTYDSVGGSAEQARSKVVAAFPGLKEAEIVLLDDRDPATFPPSDAAIATLWSSAYFVMKTRNTGAKYYFIQDYEPLFYPAGTMYALAEATYRFTLHGIVNTPGLCDLYTREYGAEAQYFVPSVDRKIFYPPEAGQRPGEPFRVFFYGRPAVDRNAFELGLSALVELKRRHRKAVEIVTAGAEIHRSVLRTYPEIKTLGLLKVEQTGDLYRRCHAGLSLMLTKHPSYLPFEMMASGTVVVANRNATNTWLLKHNENCLVGEPTASYLCDQFSLLFEDRALYQRLLAASLQTVGQYNWEQQLKKIHAFVSGVGQDPT